MCPTGFYEDDCGNCWLPYCYDYVSHNVSYDSSESSCNGTTEMWVIPGDEGDPFFNNYCDSCPEGFTPDNCGHCWQGYCYTLFADPPHTVFWDLSETECIDAGYGFYPAGSSDGDPYFGYNCEGCLDGEIEDDCGVCNTGEDSPYWNMTCGDCNGDANGYAMVDDCGDCQLAYCYDYITHESNFDTPCDGATEVLVMPDSPSNPLWNSGCDPNACPDDLVEDCAGVCGGYAMVDDCGVCSDNYYCYDYVTHQTNTDFPCDGPTEMMVMPDSDYNSDWNASCTDCGGTINGIAMVDDCGDCQSAYCYDYVTHEVSYMDTFGECVGTGTFVEANSPSNPYWNASCTDCAGEVNGYAMVDDCGDCQSAYCYDYVTHQTNTDFPCDGPTEMMVMPDDPSNPYWNSECIGCAPGDVINDGSLDVLDVVAIVSYILGNNPLDPDDVDCADYIQDGTVDVLDIVAIVNIIIGGRITSSATEAKLIVNNNKVTLYANGFIGAVQMTISHENSFSINLTNKAMVADYNTNGNITTLIIVAPDSEELFSTSSNFTIEEIIVANKESYIPVDMPSEFMVSDAYPNPFNPSTSISIYIPSSDFVNLSAYNVMGQKVATLYNGSMAAGSHTITWNASNMTSGMYFIRTESKSEVSIQRVSLVK